MMKEKKRSLSKGFSLMELLVAIALMSIVLTLGVRSFSMLTGAWNETRILGELADIAEDALGKIEVDLADTLSAQLSGVSIVGIDRVTKNKHEFNQADDADDRLIVPIQGIQSGVSLQRSQSVQYQVLRDEGRSMLVRTVGPLGDQNPSSGKSDVISRADTIRFDVSYATGDVEEPWVNEWASGTLPRAVRVSLTLADPDNVFRQVSRKQVYAVRVR